MTLMAAAELDRMLPIAGPRTGRTKLSAVDLTGLRAELMRPWSGSGGSRLNEKYGRLCLA